MNMRFRGSRGFRCGLLLLLTAAPCLAAGPSAPSRPKAEPAVEGARATATRAERLPSSVLDPSNAKIRVTSTDSNGNCPNGATKLEKCSGVYPNGNSWEISPCCRTATE